MLAFSYKKKTTGIHNKKETTGIHNNTDGYHKHHVQ